MGKHTFLMLVTMTHTYEIEATGENTWGVERACETPTTGEEESIFVGEPRNVQVTFQAKAIRRVSGPWLDSVCWYDLHGPGDIVVATRAFGSRFTKLEVELLCARLELLGLAVVATWNGADCVTLSVRCLGRRSTSAFTEGEIAILELELPKSLERLAPIDSDTASAAEQAARRYALGIESYYAARAAAGGQFEPDLDQRCDAALDGMWSEMTEKDRKAAERSFVRAG